MTVEIFMIDTLSQQSIEALKTLSHFLVCVKRKK